jgi:hypothetical protein
LTAITSVWTAGENIMATRTQIAHAVDSHLEAATAAGKERRRRGELAVSASYDPRSKRLHIELASGVAVSVPVSKVQGLTDIAASRIDSVQIDGNGYGLYWPKLDLDVSVPGLIAGCFGTRVWMTALARHGGKSTSAAKASAARENGKKGGRPRGQTASPLSRRQA